MSKRKRAESAAARARLIAAFRRSAISCGYGWAFGLHEALDQFGAMFGPLAVSAILAYRHSYREAFAVLLVPAVINLSLVLLGRFLYPRPEDMEPPQQQAIGSDLPRIFWIYLSGAVLVAAGFVDYPLIAYHFARTDTVAASFIAIFYAVAMAISGAGSLVLGRLFDRQGFTVIVALTFVSVLFAPLVFLGGFWLALAGAAIWGLGMGVHESIIPAAVSPMVGPRRRASAFGTFTACYGTFWFVGSAIIGVLYDVSIPAVIVFCMATQLAAIPIFIWVGRQTLRSHRSETPPVRRD